MNRSIFQSSPFRPSYGLQPARYNMGQGILDDITGGSVSEILKTLDEWILKLPLDVAGNYSKRRDACVAKPFWSQYKCLYDLFQDIKRDFKDGPSAPPVTPTPKPPSGIPILPIAIGGIAAAALLYLAFGRG